MSTAAKVTLATTTLSAIGIVVFVHYQQKADQAVRKACVALLVYIGTNTWQAMHLGVVRDVEQQRVKRERQLDFEMQRQLEVEYRKVQKVSDRDE
jgi:protein PET117